MLYTGTAMIAQRFDPSRIGRALAA